tara:strand:- start:60 stop:293 length:234 start_codon:yes stop_codon:yes gene_type:complete
MIYTVIFQDSLGNLSYEIFRGSPTRSQTWLDAAQSGGANNKCLVAVIPGQHNVYFYSDFANSTSFEDIKSHDLYEIT